MGNVFKTMSRLVIGALLCISGWLHWSNSYHFLNSVFKYNAVSESLGVAVAAILPFLQIVVGLSLILIIAEEGAWLACLGLSVIFITAHLILMVHGGVSDCGCFGAGPLQLTQQTSMILASIIFLGATLTLGIRMRWTFAFSYSHGNSHESQRSSRGKRKGITLIELLVVISIIGVLVSLLLPAVQFAREAARRTTCQNNLRQLGLAVAMYHQTHQALPTSTSAWLEGQNPLVQRHGMGWIVGILPFIEHQAVYDKLAPGINGDFFSGGGLMTPSIRPYLSLPVSILHCPSDGTFNSPSEAQISLEGIPVTLTNYKGVIGDTRIGGSGSIHGGSMPDCHRIGGCSGMFHRNTYQEPITFGSVHDGLSNTFLIGEDVPGQIHYCAAFFCNGDYASCNGRINFFPDTPTDWWNVATFRSYHPGGAQFVMVDGSVRFASQTFDINVYRALSTRNGNEVAAPP